MTSHSSLDVLIAQFQLQMEQFESLLVTSPREDGSADVIAERIAEGLRAREIATTLYVPATSRRAVKLPTGSAIGATNDLEAAGSTQRFSSAQLGTPALAREFLASHGTVSVVAAPGVLENPAALFLAAAADAVLLVVEARRTTRADLKRARIELQTAGGNLMGAILLS